ncbi:X2-like carbohydrate binding domain-containing protein [Cohnella cellulosilytica]|uniref:Alpha-galactosidase n=1 Tax=Cohnella cellulosilytica TaxID=986710 RepID=A0ABW2F9E4_9BACL
MIRFAKKIRTAIIVILAVSLTLGWTFPDIPSAEAASNQYPGKSAVGEKPYMGWSSYSMQVYSGNGQWITEENIKAQSDAMARYLQPYGYTYINVDAAWNGGMDGYGRPIPSTTLYPNGFTNLIDYVHAKGQKFGIYLIPGLSPQAYEQNLPVYGDDSCRMQDIAKQPLSHADYWDLTYKIDFSNPCAQLYIDSIADMIADWGVDFVKFDSVTPGSGVSDLSLDAREDVKAWSKALARHHIWLELSWALDINYADLWKTLANGWRIDWDIECYCGDGVALTTWPSVARLFPLAAKWWRHAGPGGWNDFDSLSVGNGAMDGLTRDERKTAMTFWAVSSVPIYLGNDLTRLDSYGLELLTNEEVIAVNQAGRPGQPVSIETQQQVWYANNDDGSLSVALFNLGNTEATVRVDWSDIGLSGPAAVRDLWSRQNLGTYDTGFTAEALAPHASRLLKITSQGGTVAANNDDPRLLYTGDWQRNGGQEMIATSQTFPIAISDSSAAKPSSELLLTGAEFDRAPSGQTDIVVPLRLNGNALAGIRNGASALVPGTDYTVTNDQVVIKKSYLSGQPLGIAYLTFVFDAGSPQTLGLAIRDSVDNTITLNDTDPRIVYTGSWSRSADRGLGDYMDDVHYAEDDGASFEIAFEGTGIDYITEKDSSQGDVAITLDGLQAVTSTYAPSRSVAEAVYSAQNLPSGPHTFKAEKLNGGYMLLDALRITLSPAELPEPAALDGALESERVTVNKAAPGDATVKLISNGNALAGIRNGSEELTPGSDYIVSGEEVILKQAYLAGLPNGTAYLTFVFDRGAARALAVDVIEKSLVRSLAVNNDDPTIVYTGSWGRSTGRGMGDYMDDVHYTDTIGDYFEYNFVGTGIEYVTEKDSSQGDIEVFLDGASVLYTNTSSPSRLAQQTVYSVSGLPNGAHTLKVVNRTDKKFLLLDKLNVLLEDLIAPNEGSFDKEASLQADVTTTLKVDGRNLAGISHGGQPLVRGTDYTVAGDQVTIGKAYLLTQPVGVVNLDFDFRGDHKNDIQFTPTNGDSFEYAFKGTGVRMAVQKGPDAGEIDVYIDGEFKETVDAYDAGRAANQTVFDIAGLASGTHTIKGVKKSGALMKLDALTFTTATLYSPPGSSSGGGGGGPGGGVPSPAPSPETDPEPETEVPEQPVYSEAYIKGFADGTFRPGSDITRAEIAALLSRVLQREETAQDIAFMDIREGYWANDAIARIVRMGLMKGYADGTFKGERPITRAEMAYILSMLTDAVAAEGAGFKDADSHWAQAAILKAQAAGWMKGFADGTFRPDRTLTRAEAVVILNRLIGRKPLEGRIESSWKDVPDTHWALPDIEAAARDAQP